MTSSQTDHNNNAASASASSTPPKRSNIPALVGAIGASLTTGGPTYAFGLYGAALKKNLGLSQGDLDTISTAFFVAGLLSWMPGLFADRFGARLAMGIGGCTGCASLLLYWCIAKQYIVIHSHTLLVTLLSLLGVFTFESSAMVTGSVFKVLTVTSGPRYKGPAVGVAKGLVGLGSGVYTCMFEAIKTSSESDLDFLPLAALLFVTCATLPAYWWIPSRKELQQGSDQFRFDAKPWHFQLLYASLLGMGLVIVSDSLSVLLRYHDNDNNSSNDNHHHDSSLRNEGKSPWTAVLLFLLWWGPLFTIYASQTESFGGNNDHDNDEDDAVDLADTDVTFYRTVQDEGDNNNPGNVANLIADSLPLVSTVADSGGNHHGKNCGDGDDNEDDDLELESPLQHDVDRLLSNTNSRRRREPIHSTAPVIAHTTAIHPDRNIIQMLQTPECWFLLWSSTIMVGSGTVETNNMAQMVEALQLPSVVVTPASMALFSVAQATGRVVTGAMSEVTLQSYGWPRPVYLVLAACIGCGAHLMLAWATTEMGFVLGAALSGVNFGMVWPLLVLCVGEIFGPSHVGANYMFYDGVSSAAGTFFLSKILAQSVYEEHIDPTVSRDANTCIGTDCFRMTHLFIALLCFSSIFSSIAFVRLTKDVYAPVVPIETALAFEGNYRDEQDRHMDEANEELLLDEPTNAQ